MAFTPAAGGTWFVGTERGLYRSQAGGAWTLTTVPGYVFDRIVVDPTCPSRIYAALGFAGIQLYHRGGVQMSTDTGTTWTGLAAGTPLHQGPATDIDFDPTSNRYVYVASYGLGTWLYSYAQPPACP
jgi:hypothetical protein